MQSRSPRRSIGVIGGLGALAAADLFFKLLRATPTAHGEDLVDAIFEQHAFEEAGLPGNEDARLAGRKLYVYDMLKRFGERKVDAVLLPCFLSHSFLDELTAEIRTPVVDMFDALIAHLARRHPGAKLGVLTSDLVRRKQLFQKRFAATGHELVFPSDEVQAKSVMTAIYGERGLKAGHLQGPALESLVAACEHLRAAGADVIVPGFSEIALAAQALQERGLPVLDCNEIYARYALDATLSPSKRAFKIGMVGGLGPAATVDLLDKIVRATPATRDQEHIKLVIEQNPQIPDRTANLLGTGVDPTVAMYAACKRLEADDADAIVIPCNTAHAFIDRIQPYLSIPFINMQRATLEAIAERWGKDVRVGLMATSGTIATRIYHELADKMGMTLVTPDEAAQARVMNAIYGEKGAKAGFTDGQCRDDLLAGAEYLVREEGAQVLILGCTELPLILDECDDVEIAGAHVALVDPTAVLARKCVALALEANAA
ncbi:MAG: amino acid racemase [Burkholderiaceae bacterium]